MEMLEIPPYSPDLNPIENLFQILQSEVNKVCPPGTDTNVLYEAAKEIFFNLPLSLFKDLAGRYPHRIESVLKNSGGYTKY